MNHVLIASVSPERNSLPIQDPQSVCAQLLGHVLLFVTPWTVAHQVPLSMEFSRQEYWSGHQLTMLIWLKLCSNMVSITTKPEQMKALLLKKIYLYTYTYTYIFILNWTPGVGDGQGGLAFCSSWGCKESDITERLNWTELIQSRIGSISHSKVLCYVQWL